MGEGKKEERWRKVEGGREEREETLSLSLSLSHSLSLSPPLTLSLSLSLPPHTHTHFTLITNSLTRTCTHAVPSSSSSPCEQKVAAADDSRQQKVQELEERLQESSHQHRLFQEEAETLRHSLQHELELKCSNEEKMEEVCVHVYACICRQGAGGGAGGRARNGGLKSILTSPEASTVCHNSLIFYQISKILTTA